MIASGVHLQRVLLAPEFGAACELLVAGSATLEELAAACPSGADPSRLVEFLHHRGLIAADGDDQEIALREALAGDHPSPPTATTRWPPPQHSWSPRTLGAEHFDAAPSHPLRIALVGGCVLQFLEDELLRGGRQRGYDIRHTHIWAPLGDRNGDRLRRSASSLAVLQSSVHPVMASLWDEGSLVDGEERGARLAAMMAGLEREIAEFAACLAPDALGLVHNFAPPAVSPFGRADFRARPGMRAIVATVNAAVETEVLRHANLVVVDEYQLAARHGAAALFDELDLPFGHHGGAPDFSSDELRPSPLLGATLANEYLDLYEIHHGIGRIKCVMVDLDGTLWPGVAAETGFGWLEGDSTSRWVALGINQALRHLKHRGILLVGVSKGSHAATVSVWEKVEHPLLLHPKDFVELRIGWGPKSEAIEDFCRRTGVAPESTLFLDDNPVERAEVARNLPAVQVLDVPVREFRQRLLSMPGCEVSHLTEESRNRTATTKALIRRDELRRRSDQAAFLANLQIRIEVRAATHDDEARVAELLSRTTQFTTTGRHLRADEISALIDGPTSEVHVLLVSDRFASYGLSGACVLDGNEITAFAISCRVIGLEVAVPFLEQVLRASDGSDNKLRGRVVETPRNEPARGIFTLAGFMSIGDGWYELDRDARASVGSG